MTQTKTTDTAQPISMIATAKADYYDTTKKKVVDFCIGFFIPIAIGLVFSAVQFPLQFFYRNNVMGFFVIAGAIIMLITDIIIIVVAFNKGRRYIGIGAIVTVVVIPLLILGACFIIIANLGF